MKKLVLVTLGLAVAGLLVGCGTIKETTTTEIADVNVPAEKQSETKYIPIYIEPSDAFIDSIKQWTLINLCKGEVKMEKGNLKSDFSFHVKKDSTKKINQLVVEAKSDVESKERNIEGEKITKEKESTPGNLWILFHSWIFTIPALILGIIIGMFLYARTAFAKRIIS